MTVVLVVVAADGTEREGRYTARLTDEGIALDGPGLSLRDGDRVVWVTDEGYRGAFDVNITPPALH
jgi:hypothetical protein